MAQYPHEPNAGVAHSLGEKPLLVQVMGCAHARGPTPVTRQTSAHGTQHEHVSTSTGALTLTPESVPTITDGHDTTTAARRATAESTGEPNTNSRAAVHDMRDVDTVVGHAPAPLLPSHPPYPATRPIAAHAAEHAAAPVPVDVDDGVGTAVTGFGKHGCSLFSHELLVHAQCGCRAHVLPHLIDAQSYHSLQLPSSYDTGEPRAAQNLAGFTRRRLAARKHGGRHAAPTHTTGELFTPS